MLELARKLGRRGGRKGGKAGTVKLTLGQRSKIAKKAARTRWDKKRRKEVDQEATRKGT